MKRRFRRLHGLQSRSEDESWRDCKEKPIEIISTYRQTTLILLVAIKFKSKLSLHLLARCYLYLNTVYFVRFCPSHRYRRPTLELWLVDLSSLPADDWLARFAVVFDLQHRSIQSRCRRVQLDLYELSTTMTSQWMLLRFTLLWYR